MKFKKLVIAVTVLTAMLVCTAFPACSRKRVQDLNYTESTEKINNPDQGFYRPVFVRATDSGITYNKNIINNSTQLYHLRIDISVFSKAVNGTEDKLLTEAVIDGLDSLLSYLRERDKNAIVRFAYDPYYNGGKDKEPEQAMILKHIEQVCPVINAYGNTVTAVEVGLIGPWGEMHSSKIANAEHITPIIQSFLDNTQSVPVLVRTPKMIYDYLGITVNDIDGYTIDAKDKAYRLGLFNDGYLGSDNDLGTYTDRAREVEFLSGQTERLPYGGEVVIPTSKLHDIETCLPEMNKLNLSYLNIEWNNQVIDKWKNSTYTQACGTDEIYYGKSAFDYIENHMGYRYVLTESVFKYPSKPDSLQIELSLKNVGFGNLNRTKRTKIIFTDESGEIAYSHSLDDYTGGETLVGSVSFELDSGKYDVYLRIYGEVTDSPKYCLQFANEGIWNEELKANKIGEIEV